MIKLIVSDMDGSLLDGEHRLPPDFAQVFSKLKELDIPFVVASGRSYVSLKPYLAQMPDAPACICNNGAFIMEHGQVASIHPLPTDVLKRVLEACAQLPELKISLCGIHGTYYLEDGSEFSHTIQTFFEDHKSTPSFASVEDVIFTVGVSDSKGPLLHSLPFLTEQLGDLVSIRISGPTWMDITDHGVTKGAALCQLQKRLGVTPQETMAFGDNYNDIEMLTNAGFSFVMENAAPEMRQYGKYVAKCNREYGVTDAIWNYVLSTK